MSQGFAQNTGITTPVSLSQGGTGTSLTADNGGIVYSGASTLSILAHTTTAGLALLSGNNAAPSWSTSKPITQINIQVFTSTGANTYTPTTGTTYAHVELWGAGGGGGASAVSIPGAAGGAGAYASSIVVNPTSVTISIGTGGNGQAANNGTAGTAGGNTTYNTTTIVAAGGSAGSNATPGAGGTVAACTGTKKIAGGSGNQIGIAGFFGAGGSSPGLTPANTNDLAGSQAGAANSGQGGGPGTSAVAGSAGGSGYAVVTEFISV